MKKDVVTTLRERRGELADEITRIDAALAALEPLEQAGGRGRHLSEAGRRAISRAAKARWKKHREAKAQA